MCKAEEPAAVAFLSFSVGLGHHLVAKERTRKKILITSVCLWKCIDSLSLDSSQNIFSAYYN